MSTDPKPNRTLAEILISKERPTDEEVSELTERALTSVGLGDMYSRTRPVEPTPWRGPHCRVCGDLLEIGEGWWRCKHPSHPAGARMPERSMGDIYGWTGQPWGKLLDRNGRGLLREWREQVRRHD